MTNILEGVLHKLGDEKVISDTFKVRDVIVLATTENNGKVYENYIKVQFKNEDADLISKVEIDTPIAVDYNLKGRKYEKDGKISFFNSVEAWKFEVTKGVQPETNDLPWE